MTMQPACPRCEDDLTRFCAGCVHNTPPSPRGQGVSPALPTCDAWAEDRGLVIDCRLPLGHPGSHDPGEIDWTMAPGMTAPAQSDTPAQVSESARVSSATDGAT